MTERELKKLGRRELLTRAVEQERQLDEAQERLDALEQENAKLMESLAKLGEKLGRQRDQETLLRAALSKKLADCESLSRELGEARTGREGLEAQVQQIAEKFAQLKSALLDKEKKLRTADRQIAEQEKTIRILQGLLSAGPGQTQD